MANWKFFASCICIIVCLNSCQRELYFPQAISKGTLKSGTSGNCLSSTSHGAYHAAIDCTPDDYIEVSVDVKKAGLYIIASDTVNGYSFFANGKFDQQGINTVRLIGTGKPLLKKTDVFTIQYDKSIWNFSIITDSATTGGGGGGTVQATYTLGGNPNDCSPVTIAGTYIVDFGLSSSSNFIKVQVNVLTVGDYVISTPIINGCKFSAYGTFTTTGVQDIYLKGSGSPSITGTNVYTVSASNGQLCSFSINVLPHSNFSFSGAPGTCFPVTVQGVYKKNTPLTSANKVTLQVDVHTIGYYIISTDIHANFYFSTTGFFTTTGLQNVTLDVVALDDPNAAGVYSYTAQPNIATCRFDVNVLP